MGVQGERQGGREGGRNGRRNEFTRGSFSSTPVTATGAGSGCDPVPLRPGLLGAAVGGTGGCGPGALGCALEEQGMFCPLHSHVSAGLTQLPPQPLSALDPCFRCRRKIPRRRVHDDGVGDLQGGCGTGCRSRASAQSSASRAVSFGTETPVSAPPAGGDGWAGVPGQGGAGAGSGRCVPGAPRPRWAPRRRENLRKDGGAGGVRPVILGAR